MKEEMGREGKGSGYCRHPEERGLGRVALAALAAPLGQGLHPWWVLG